MKINNFFETTAADNLREGGFENLRFEALKVKKRRICSTLNLNLSVAFKFWLNCHGLFPYLLAI